MALDTAPKGWRSVARYSMLTIVALFILFPVYTTVIAALKPGNRVLDNPLVPNAFTLDVLKDAWSQGRLGRYLTNTTIVALIITSVQLVTSIASAYAFSFLKFPFKRLVFGIFLSTMLVPLEVTLVVNRRTIDSLGWLNSFQGLTIPFVATAFGTFLLRQVFMQIPPDLREAAQMDGLGHWGFMKEVAIPLVRPTLGALGLFSFLSSWNQYLWPSLITTEDDMNTLQTGLRLLASSDLDKPNLIMAGTIIAAVPILIVLVLFQKQLVRGLTAGAVKG
jgi:sn-glycerol 3-phosphate transport system permease protein